MKKIKFSRKGKSPAQAMVEFALVLPILLLLVYGLLEVGRLLFIYSSVVSAARQAARYGSTTGVNTLGGVPRYQDCAGMRDEAKRVAFLNRFTDADIEIWHDEGEGKNQVSYCPPGQAVDSTNFQPTVGNINRIRVRVRTQYSPIVPLVPLQPFTIESVSARTILVSVPIAITAAPQTWDPGWSPVPPPPSDTPIPSETSTPEGTPTDTPTPTITFTPSKTGTPTKTGSPTNTGTPTGSATPTGTAFPCDVRHGVLKLSPFSMTIFNQSPNTTILITQIQIYWNPSSPAGQYLSQLTLGGVTIWSGNTTATPAVFSVFTGDMTLGPNSSKLLSVSFDKSYKDNGTEQILVSFAEYSCPLLDSSNSGQLP